MQTVWCKLLSLYELQDVFHSLLYKKNFNILLDFNLSFRDEIFPDCYEPFRMLRIIRYVVCEREWITAASITSQSYPSVWDRKIADCLNDLETCAFSLDHDCKWIESAVFVIHQNSIFKFSTNNCRWCRLSLFCHQRFLPFYDVLLWAF